MAHSIETDHHKVEGLGLPLPQRFHAHLRRRWCHRRSACWHFEGAGLSKGTKFFA